MILDTPSQIKLNLEKRNNTWMDTIKLILSGGPLSAMISLMVMCMVFMVIIIITGGWVNFITYHIKECLGVKNNPHWVHTCIGSYWGW